MLSLLKKLTDAIGVSGCETTVRDIIIKEIKNCVDEFRVDGIGNLIAYKSAKNSAAAKTVLLSAHMDEVGFIVSDICEDGYLKFQTVGGIDTRILVSQRVVVNGCSGVIALKAIHLTNEEERKKSPSEEELYIDIGAKNREETEKWVMKGDYGCFDSKYIEFGDMIKAKALDDRIGCAVLIEMLKSDFDVNLICTFTVQEEVGLRGARCAAYGLHPDFAVVVEGTTCSDLPGVSAGQRVTKSGSGAAISVLDSASCADDELAEMLRLAAESRDIPYQLKAACAGGNDAGAIYISGGGIKTASISVPCRYIHSPVSAASKRDIESCGRIVKGFLEDCGRRIEND